MMQEFEYRLMYQGMKMDDYLKYTGLTKEQVAADYKDQAARNVKIRFVLEAIIKAENVVPDTDAVNKKIEEMAKEQKKSADDYKKTMDQRYLNYLLNQSLSDALMAKLKELNPAKAVKTAEEKTDKAEKPAKPAAEKAAKPAKAKATKADADAK